MTQEALKLALTALEINLTLLEKITPYKGQEDFLSDAIAITQDTTTFIKKALAQPEQEPEAWMYQEYRDDDQFGWRDEIQFVQPPNDPNYFRNIVPVYTTPLQRTWLGLADEEIDHIYTGVRAVHHDVDSNVFCRAIEAKLKEKNNA